jgi:hypothetical protein
LYHVQIAVSLQVGSALDNHQSGLRPRSLVALFSSSLRPLGQAINRYSALLTIAKAGILQRLHPPLNARPQSAGELQQQKSLGR